jgi:hypothetical protein
MDHHPKSLYTVPDADALDPDVVGPILDYLQHHLAGYPFDVAVDTPFVEELARDFPDLDILEEIKAFRWYYEDSPLSRVRKPRVALRRWLANARPRDRR